MKKQTFGLPQVQRKISDQGLGVPFQLHQANAYTFLCPIAAAQDPSREHENANELQPCDWCQKWVLLHREGEMYHGDVYSIDWSPGRCLPIMQTRYPASRSDIEV
jgi:hypothetical protein